MSCQCGDIGCDLPDPPQPAGLTRDEPMLRWFNFAHLPEGIVRDTSHAFASLAEHVVEELPRSAERTVALRKLLEAKDAAVRAAVDEARGNIT